MSTTSTSFLARLWAVESGTRRPFTVTRLSGIAGGGWIELASAGTTAEQPIFRFEGLHLPAADRIPYTIRCQSGPYADSFLDTSANGYLGLYASVSADRFWKVQPAAPWLPTNGALLKGYLRDHRGHRACLLGGSSTNSERREFSYPGRRTTDRRAYLNVDSGTPIELTFEVTELLPPQA